MAYLAVVGSKAVNGVAAIHSEIIKQTIFKVRAAHPTLSAAGITQPATIWFWHHSAHPSLVRGVQSGNSLHCSTTESDLFLIACCSYPCRTRCRPLLQGSLGVGSQDQARPGSIAVQSSVVDGHQECYLAVLARTEAQLLRLCGGQDFYDLSPSKFQNKTNGVTPRRWLAYCNPRLAALITQTLGNAEWIKHADQLQVCWLTSC